MNRDDIQELKAGRTLNIFVAEKIMKNKVVPDPIMGDTEIFITETGESVFGKLTQYSQDLSKAQLVISKIAGMGYAEAGLWENEKRPEVICRAALLTLFDKKSKKKRAIQKSKFTIIK
ncbi:MAG: hypothetical protein KKC46_06835 [Proteobacteria bacterium]|nr:hypothetical protein [Pseudomonadota bacterium]